MRKDGSARVGRAMEWDWKWVSVEGGTPGGRDLAGWDFGCGGGVELLITVVRS
jgi:hypothetical protein